MLAPSTRAADLVAGRRALHHGERGRDGRGRAGRAGLAARLASGVPVGVRANLALALQHGSLRRRARLRAGRARPLVPRAARRRDAHGRHVPRRRAPRVPAARRTQRERLLARVDALVAPDDATAEAAAQRFPGDYRIVPLGAELWDGARSAREAAASSSSRPPTSAARRARVLRALRELPGWEAVLLRTKPLIARARRSRARSRTRVRRAHRPRRPPARSAAATRPRSSCPAPGGSRACCARGRRPPAARSPTPPRRRGAAGARRRGRRAARRGRRATRAPQPRRAPRPRAQTFADVAAELEQLYEVAREAAARPTRPRVDPLADRDWIVADLHMHTSWSHDCSIDAAELLDHAEAEGLGAIAVTDHNVFGGALEAVELARDRELIVIPGEEVKTDDQGEVIGLFLHEEIPRGMSFAETVAAIREQDGLVYVPHPFDRMHAIPSPATLHRHLADIDVFEVYNARLLFEAYNDEALRFARKYDLLAGAGSDAHVLQGVGTGALRMRALRRPGGVPALACAPPRCCADRSRSPTSRGSSGWPRSRRRSARAEVEPAPWLPPCRPTRSTSATSSKAIREINELGHEVAARRTRRTSPCSAPGTRWPTSSCSSTRRSLGDRTRASPSTAAPARR